jgi:hypothetical protein
MKAVTLSFGKVETKRIDISQGHYKMLRNIMSIDVLQWNKEEFSELGMATV